MNLNQNFLYSNRQKKYIRNVLAAIFLIEEIYKKNKILLRLQFTILTYSIEIKKTFFFYIFHLNVFFGFAHKLQLK